MPSVDAAVLDRITEAIHQILTGRKSLPVSLPADYPDDELRQVVTYVNRLGAEPATATEEGCVYDLVPVAHEFGFYWGGHFSRRDGMHFELARVP